MKLDDTEAVLAFLLALFPRRFCNRDAVTDCGSPNLTIVSRCLPGVRVLPQDDPRQHGVGFAVKNSLIPVIEPPTGRSERILPLGLSTSTGRQGIGKMNENGQRLLELCCHHGLCVTNTYFKCKERHKVSWTHNRSRHWHQLDVVITRRANLRIVLHTRSFHSADCDTNHSLVGCKVRLITKKICRSKTKGLPRINT
ncbi:unnamed protein product [Acanthosepion pharaonis]|uniref:Uncharacterized protein n=1 Tax=Acanthosepion pharaonis TaxID=158019 RepID=A0A812DF07_ACAPH|nr:unnamed protein product [Sepia pharaonis]